MSGTLDGSDESKLIAEPRADLDGLAYGVLLESRGRSAPRRADPPWIRLFGCLTSPQAPHTTCYTDGLLPEHPVVCELSRMQ